MQNRLYKILIYFFMPIFLMQCSSKKEDITASESDIEFLQGQLDDLEYIVKNSVGSDDLEKFNSLNQLDADENNQSETIQILKAKINYLEKELSKMVLHPGTWENPFSIYNKNFSVPFCSLTI